MKRLAIILAVLACASAASAQQREYRHNGYWQYNRVGCDYKWVWYPYQKQASYESKVINLTWNNYGVKPEKGNTQYSVGDYDPLSMFGTATSADFAHLSGKFVDAGKDIGTLALASYDRETTIKQDVARHAFSVERTKALALVAERTSPEAFTAEVEKYHRSEVRVESNFGAPRSLTAIQKACLDCHGGEARNGGEVKLMPDFTALNKEQADAMLDYITVDENNCGHRAKLSRSQHKELRDYLYEKKHGN